MVEKAQIFLLWCPPTVTANVMQMMKIQTANLAFIYVSPAVDVTKIAAHKRNPCTKRIYKVQSPSVPVFWGVDPTSDKCRIPGQPEPEPGSGCCESPMNGGENTRCIPNGVNGCQPTALPKSTCCGPHGNSNPGSIFQNVLHNFIQGERPQEPFWRYTILSS